MTITADERGLLPRSAIAKYMGRPIEKEFPGHGMFRATVTRVDVEEGLIQVTYTDGDQEELEEDELLEVLVDEQLTEAPDGSYVAGGPAATSSSPPPSSSSSSTSSSFRGINRKRDDILR